MVKRTMYIILSAAFYALMAPFLLATETTMSTSISESREEKPWDFNQSRVLHEAIIEAFRPDYLFQVAKVYRTDSQETKVRKTEDEHYLYLGSRNPRMGSLVFLLSDEFEDCKGKPKEELKVSLLLTKALFDSKQTTPSCARYLKTTISGPVKSTQAVYEDQGNLMKLKGGFALHFKVSEISTGGSKFYGEFKIVSNHFVRDLLNVAHKALGISKENLFAYSGVDVLAVARHYLSLVKERALK